MPHPNKLRGEQIREAILEFIEDFVRDNGWPPSHKEIARHLGVVISAVRPHLLRLAKEGKIEMGSGPREIRVVDGHGHGRDRGDQHR